MRLGGFCRLQKWLVNLANQATLGMSAGISHMIIKNVNQKIFRLALCESHRQRDLNCQFPLPIPVNIRPLGNGVDPECEYLPIMQAHATVKGLHASNYLIPGKRKRLARLLLRPDENS